MAQVPPEMLTDENTNTGLSEQIQPAPEQTVEAPQEPAMPVQLEEPTTSPTVITTDSLRSQLDEAQQRLDRLKTEAAPQVVQQQQVPEQPKPTVFDDDPAVDPFQSQIDNFTASADKKINDTKSQFNRYMQRSSSLLKSQINSLNATFDQRRDQAQEVADNAMAATNVIGSRTGRMRYAPEIHSGIITGQENALIETLATIDAQEQAAIAAAEAAAFDRDYSTFLTEMETISSIESQREQTLAELQSVMQEENTRRAEKAEEQRNELAVIEQFAAGETDPVAIFSALDGNVPYDVIVEYSNTLPEGYGQPTVVAGMQVTPTAGGVSVGGQSIPTIGSLSRETATPDDIEALPISQGAKAWVRMWSQGRMTVDDILSTMGTSNASQALKNEVVGVISQMEQPTADAPEDKDMKDYMKEQAQVALTAIQDIKDIFKREGIVGEAFDLTNTAVGRSLGQFLPGTKARDLRARLDTIEALIGFDALADMRAASPTGGALGQVTERELKFLQSVQGSLDVGQTTDSFANSIKRIEQSFKGILEENNITTPTAPAVSSQSNSSLLLGGTGVSTDTSGGVPDVLQGL